MPTNLFASFLKLRQPEPPEGRAMFPLGSGNGGGDGMNFAVGTEVFQFNTNQVPGGQRPSAILGMWVDARNLTAGKNLIITTPTQTFVFAGGNQGYVPITAPMPLNITITTNGGTGTVFMILYNYNPLFTGSVATAPPQGTVSSGGGGISGTGGGGGGGGAGFSEPGGRPGTVGGPTF
ncbi:MAG TPA: hypothetical protein VN785_12260 [Candidatus Angelobacter sp.]|nr:hypothetical protein [Candidatus Angelobacter sp.]